MIKCSKCGVLNPDDTTYCQNCQAELKRDPYNTICILALVLSIVGFIFNPFYLVSIAGLVLGIIGHINGGPSKNLAMAGWIVAICAAVVSFLIDIFCTFGLGIFC